MATKYHDIIVKVKKDKIIDIKNRVKDILSDEISPDFVNSVRRLLLYRKLNPPAIRDIPTFKLTNAGLLSNMMIENLDMSGAKIGKGSESRVEVQKTDKGSEVIIQVEADSDAKDAYDDLSPEDILNDIAKLNPAIVNTIIDEAFRRAGF